VSASVSYVPGSWSAIATPTHWLLLHTPASNPLVRILWSLVGAGASTEALLAAVLESPSQPVPDFGLVLSAEEGLRVFVRGDASVEVHRPAEPAQILTGSSGVSWTESLAHLPIDRLVLRGGDDAAENNLPAAAGILLATSVTVVFDAPPEAGLRPAGQMAGAHQHRLGQLLDSHRVDDTRGFEDLDAIAESAIEPGPDRTDMSEEPSVAVPSEPLARPYSHLFEATQQRSVEDAAVRIPDHEFEVAAPLVPTAPPAPPVASTTSDRERPAASRLQSPAPAQAKTLIDSVPWTSRNTAPATSRDPDLAPAADSLGPSMIATSPPLGQPSAPVQEATVNRAQLRELAGLGEPRPGQPTGPTVRAVFCAQGHPNPPHTGKCRLCQAVLDDKEPVTVPRPVLGVLRLSTGDVVALDRGVVLGREPQDGATQAGDRSHVVKVPSATGDVSRTHLTVQLDGWHVLVTDLRSTNGTLITAPGQPPQQLRANEPTPIQPGTLVTLSDDVWFLYEVGE